MFWLWTDIYLSVYSQRTNSAAFEQLSRLFPARVFAIPVAAGLHLKSVLSAIDEDTLLVAGNAAARAMGQRILASFPPNHQKQMVEVPDAVAANVVRVGQTLLIQDAYPRSEHILLELAKSLSLSCVKLDMSELIKADGALTCCRFWSINSSGQRSLSLRAPSFIVPNPLFRIKSNRLFDSVSHLLS